MGATLARRASEGRASRVSGTGVARQEVDARVKAGARIFASPGPQFGPGGEGWLRFNFATPRPILQEALGRLEDAFKDLRA